jgi:PEP-CTERM motif
MILRDLIQEEIPYVRGLTYILRVVVACLFFCAATPSLFAAVLDLETFSGPSVFADAGSADTLTIPTSIGQVMISGGVILSNATFSTSNTTSIYATANNLEQFGLPNDPTRLNPITVTFPVPITNFFLDVINGLPARTSYMVADNAGNSASFELPTTLEFGGFTQIGFAAAGTVVTIGSTTGLPAWDFAIDNIHFNEPLPPDLSEVPEPATAMLITAGLLAIMAGRKRSAR